MGKWKEVEVRAIVDAHGWAAVRAHPVYGPLMRARKLEAERYVDACEIAGVGA